MTQKEFADIANDIRVMAVETAARYMRYAATVTVAYISRRTGITAMTTPMPASAGLVTYSRTRRRCLPD